MLLKKSQIARRQFSCCKKSDRRPPIDVASITLPRSPASLSAGNEVPHIFTRKSRVAKRNFDHECKKTFSTASTRRRHQEKQARPRRPSSCLTSSPAEFRVAG